MQSAHLLIIPLPGEPILHHSVVSILRNTSVILENELGARFLTEISI